MGWGRSCAENHMAIENCQNCGEEFDSQKNRYTKGLNYLFWPSERFEALFTVRCPHCGIAYVSDNVRLLGLIPRKYFFPLLFVLIICLVLFDAYFK